jgi:hypothetical protein
LLLGVFALALVLTGAPREVQAGTITIANTSVRSEDPTSIRFSARVNTSAGVESAEFIYSVANPDGNVGGGGFVDVSPGGELDLIFELETSNADRYIPVGSTITYFWKVIDREGAEQRSEVVAFTFLDGRFDWEEITGGGVTVFYYGSLEHAEQALGATQSALDDISALLQTEVSYPVKVVVWRTESEGELAQQRRGATFQATVITGGSRVAPDLLHVYDALTSFVDVVRHEAAHIVTHVAGDGPFTRVPAWLDEGTAVYAQLDVGRGYDSGLDFAIQTDTLFRLRSINSPANVPERVNSFYGQSWSTVDYLITEYGEDTFAELYATIFAGSDIEGALQTVYGLNSDQLYNEWRSAHRLSPIDFAEIEDGGFAPTEATVAPLGIPTAVSAAPSGGSGGSSGESSDVTPGGDGQGAGAEAASDGGSSSGLIVLLVAGLFALVLGGGAFVLLRRPSS